MVMLSPNWFLIISNLKDLAADTERRYFCLHSPGRALIFKIWVDARTDGNNCIKFCKARWLGHHPGDSELHDHLPLARGTCFETEWVSVLQVAWISPLSKGIHLLHAYGWEENVTLNSMSTKFRRKKYIRKNTPTGHHEQIDIFWASNPPACWLVVFPMIFLWRRN